jgi:hypothetical protein
LGIRPAFRNVFDMNGLQNLAFGQLLAAWIRRDDARHSGNFRQLGEARMALDDARNHMRSTFINPR